MTKKNKNLNNNKNNNNRATDHFIDYWILPSFLIDQMSRIAPFIRNCIDFFFQSNRFMYDTV